MYSSRNNNHKNFKFCPLTLKFLIIRDSATRITLQKRERVTCKLILVYEN